MHLIRTRSNIPTLIFRRNILLFTFFILALGVNGQNISSLRAKLTTEKDVKKQLMYLDTLGNAYRNITPIPDSSIYFYTKRLKLSQSNRLHDEIGLANYELAINYIYYKVDYKKSLTYAEKILDVAKLGDYNLLMSKYHHILAILSLRHGGKKLLYHLEQLTQYASETADENWKGISYGVSGTLADVFKAREFAEKSYLKCLEILEPVNVDEWFTYGLDYALFLERNRNQKPIWLYRKLARKKKQLTKSKGEFVYLNDLARLEAKLDNYEEAESLIFDSITQIENQSKPDTLRLYHAYKHLAEVYETSGDKTGQIEALKKFHEYDMYMIRKSVTENSKISLIELSQRLEVEKKENEIRLLENKREIELLYLLIAFLVILVLVCFLILLQRSKLKIQEQKTELIQLNTTKDKLFGLLSHDLQSPIANLQTFLNLIQWGALNQKEFAESITLFNTQLGSVRAMLDNLLQWAISQLGGIKPSFSSLSIAPVLHNQIELLLPNLHAKNIHLVHTIDPALTIFADVNHFTIIVRNILQNAVKFTQSGGQIQIQTYLEKESVVIQFKDSGIGIPTNQIDTLFQINKEPSRLGTAQEKGTGLGLVLVKQLVDSNHATIQVSSKPNQGTTFRIVFKSYP